ncbi:Uncharacterised protein [Legionella lansingensis]|uniref:Uncharacterized protein n=1 Tax=Legionella lansingensis TaxID=45067 RepID=A0A0W0VGS6_9GAMM|nr:hypothetical protein Llan_2444 [Legionella lansingensis]SNV52829.1 Uncharacterised protein [Legionella lansingensis]
MRNHFEGRLVTKTVVTMPLRRRLRRLEASPEALEGSCIKASRRCFAPPQPEREYILSLNLTPLPSVYASIKICQNEAATVYSELIFDRYDLKRGGTEGGLLPRGEEFSLRND